MLVVVDISSDESDGSRWGGLKSCEKGSDHDLIVE